VVTELSKFTWLARNGLQDIGGDLLEADFGTTSSDSASRRNFRLARQPEGIAATRAFGLATPKPTFQRKFSTV
jgi:hypothetical protein